MKRLAHRPRPDDGGLGRTCGRNDEVDALHRSRHGHQTIDRSQRTVESEFAHCPEIPELLGIDLLAGREDTQGDGKVEARPGLADTTGREVDRHALRRPGESGGQDGRSDTVSGLATRDVGQTDDGEPRDAVSGMDLDRDGVAVNSGHNR